MVASRLGPISNSVLVSMSPSFVKITDFLSVYPMIIRQELEREMLQKITNNPCFSLHIDLLRALTDKSYLIYASYHKQIHC